MKRCILLKKKEMAVLLREEIRVEETVDLWQKKVAHWESVKVSRWMWCCDGITNFACHVTDVPAFPSADARPVLGKNLAKIEARLGMEKARQVAAKEQADYSVTEPARKTVLSKERKPDQEPWVAAGGRRGQNRNGKPQILLHKDKMPSAEKYR